MGVRIKMDGCYDFRRDRRREVWKRGVEWKREREVFEDAAFWMKFNDIRLLDNIVLSVIPRKEYINNLL